LRKDEKIEEKTAEVWEIANRKDFGVEQMNNDPRPG
jgi:hypothetical protein